MKTAILLLSLSITVQAQPQRLRNARVETRKAEGNLAAQVLQIAAAQDEPAWLGYQVESVPRHFGGCDVDLEGSNRVQLEPSRELYVFYRMAARKIERVRTLSPDCEIDAGGVTVYWLTGVRAAQSIALLESLVNDHTNSAIAAIAMHSDAAADTALDRLIATDKPENVRRQTAFWMGNARGRHGYEVLVRVLRQDPSDNVREHAIFALTQSKEPDAIKTIIAAAHDDRSARVRGQALFWLAQKAGKQIAATEIAASIERDPETEVKKRAVFALTQIPNGDGVPQLIQVARTNRNAEVRKRAMFWLGQSKDPRALKFFEEVLSR